jgi:hypothetical protein
MKKIMLLGVALALLGCGGGMSEEEQACEEVADAVAAAAKRCGQDYQVNHDAFEKNLPGGSCSGIKHVRDINALKSTCIPSLASVSCSDLMAAKIDASCLGQLGP